MKFGIYVVAISWLLSRVFAVNIQQSTVEIDQGVKAIENLTIHKIVYYSIINSPQVTVLHSFKNAGTFYVTSTNGFEASVVIKGDHFQNSGLVVFNSFLVNESIHGVDVENDFANTGAMLFGVSGFNPYSSVTFVLSDGSWVNTGMISFLKLSEYPTRLYIGRSQRLKGGLSITNEGTICFYSQIWASYTRIKGHGCITVGSKSKLEIYFPDYRISPTQTINLESSDSLLQVYGMSSSLDIAPTIKVSGLGEGNSIEVDIPYLTMNAKEYSTRRGELSVEIKSKPRVYFRVGRGYRLVDFQIRPSAFGTRITVHKPAPRKPPRICKCATKIPVVPTYLP
ncbi:hypothetical protein METBIDRAFT_9402 [Metschnikowia bicuspidata var. bicuspidata NRRL YB-4993]|uniref:Hyphally-regulated cell wall protein N-terminal domain-containing protein n=1 Tax=Metschnikowia bicuspidata var. bicuspidata NRRL YB-4993 TaxID=869754 RepID=A0A1A0HG03_9ASCO|nr:hypothetical protein METBIDRAFT_9402 [Metschnikowia bicuspidata var. bicuspidata NRRL YB-4993]OBA23089.1 hypothetical protein METBIDRAFT_9402 [Metschnikowia bicuspidata var. bicuspidata NRRL YB-4993]